MASALGLVSVKYCVVVYRVPGTQPVVGGSEGEVIQGQRGRSQRGDGP